MWGSGCKKEREMGSCMKGYVLPRKVFLKMRLIIASLHAYGNGP